jgi:AAA domain
MTIADFITRLRPDAHATRAGKGWSARCPAHEDGTASLSIDEGKDGRVLVYCHAGCQPEAICSALGITLQDLMRNGDHRTDERAKIVATYDYSDEKGALLFQVCRLEPKTFRQRKPDRSSLDGWTWSTKGVRRVPYHLPELINAVRNERPVFVVEGEKDADALIKLGFAATCNPSGAGKWLDSFSPYFKGANITIIPDKDEPGRKHAESVAFSLNSTAACIRLLELPDLGERKVKDASDWIAAGGEPAELDELVEAAPAWQANGTTKSANPFFELLQDGAAIQREQLPPIVQLIEGLFCPGTKLVIGSSSKSYKTWVTIHLGLALAHGVEFLGRATIRTRVLYVNLELRPEAFKRRVQIVAKALGIEVEGSQFIHLPLRGYIAGLPLTILISRLVEVAREKQIGVVVLDPQYKLNVEGEENSSRDMTRLSNEIDRLTTEGQCGVVLNDHFTKGNQSEKDALDTLRGSSAKGGDLDAALILRKHEVNEAFRVDVIHRELPPVEPFCIGWEFPLMRLREDLSPDLMKKAKAGRAKAYNPVDLLYPISDTSAEEPISVSAWAKSAKVHRTTLLEYLPGLRQKGWLATVGDGNTARQYLTAIGKRAIGNGEEGL